MKIDCCLHLWWRRHRWSIFREVIGLEATVKRLYEGMFLVDSAQAAAEWDGVLEAIRTVLDRAGAEIVSMKKWDECRLAYEIRGTSRGTYILTYFKADGQKIREIERDVQLSERIMRVIILNAESRGKEDISAVPGTPHGGRRTASLTGLTVEHKGPVRKDSQGEQKQAQPQRQRIKEGTDKAQGTDKEPQEPAAVDAVRKDSIEERRQEEQKS